MKTLSADYQTARDLFVDRARTAGAEITSVVHPERGPDGEELAMDVAWFGPRDAETVVVTVSGTHGAEGFAGSALQSAWFAEHEGSRPPDTAHMAVHALNPFGFAWTRRVNEGNIDLNRNFIYFNETVPENPDYEGIADLLVPREWNEESIGSTTMALLGLAEEKGWDWLQSAVSRGQYSHPTGLFFGGRGPAWSHLELKKLFAGNLGSARRVAVLDLHTGLGPWGHGELISSDAPDSEPLARANSWYHGDVIPMAGGESVSAVLQGEWLARVPAWIPGAEVTSVAIEYGTIEIVGVLQALRADAWLWAHGDPTSPEAEPIRAQVRAAFADDDPAWLARLREQFELRMHQAMSGLGS